MNRDNEIRREIQSKFNDYRVPVPPDGWDRLEQSLNAAMAARRIVRRRWYAASAVAAVILLVGGLLYNRPAADISTPLVSESKPSVSGRESQYDGTAKGEVQTHTGTVVTTTPSGSLQSHAGQEKQRKSGIGEYAVSEKKQEMLHRERTLLVKAERNISENDIRSVIKQSKLQLGEPLTRNRGDDEFITVGEEQTGLINGEEPEQTGTGGIILAMNGRGGLAPFQQTVNSPMTLRTAQMADNIPPMNDSRMFTANNTAGNVSEMEHDQPISFGITVSKSFFDDLSLETGLLYTYLSSKVRNSGTNFQVQETQHLHYIGIPLNVNYNLFSLKKLDVYASVGGMLEKDVYGEYRRKGEGKSTELNISSEEEITKISQHNPQISVNAGVGISYPVWQNFKLYGKIGGAYYFDANNQYKTIYSDSKIVMDLNVGLRYEFK
jgi:hypothetical protein